MYLSYCAYAHYSPGSDLRPCSGPRRLPNRLGWSLHVGRPRARSAPGRSAVGAEAATGDGKLLV